MNIKKLLDPTTTVVLVVDKQAGYFDPSFVKKRHRDLPTNSTKVLDLIDSFIVQSRSAGVEVVWTQMIEDIDMSPSPIAAIMGNDPDGIVSITKPGNPSFEIYGKVKPEYTEKIFIKYRYNAFSHTELAEYLKSRGIKTVIFVGGYASRCVLSTVVGANGEDLFCVVPKNLVLNQANASSEVEVLYNIVDAIFGTTLRMDEILSAWET